MSQHTPHTPHSSSTRRTYTGPSARTLAESLTDGRPKRSGRGWYSVRGVCHDGGHRPSGGSLSLLDGDNGLVVKCFKGCDRRTIIEALEASTGLSIWDARDGAQVRICTRRPAPAQAAPAKTSRSHHHLQLWTDAERVPPASPEHPARRWLAARNLYWPQLPLPAALRWLPAIGRWPEHLGAGAIIALFAPPADWLNAWPRLPWPTAVELVHVDSSGSPALDRPEDGLSKRTHGSRAGAVCLMGDPRPEASTTGTLLLAEGLADALALAARLPHTTAAVGGTSGLNASTFGRWLSSWASVQLHADADADGLAAARRVGRRVQNVQLLRMADVKDVADFAASDPLPHVDLDAARELAADLEAEGLPRWEAARQAVLSVGEPPEPDANTPDGSNAL